MRKHKPAQVQASEVTYELHSLGWKAFQNLCVTLTAEIWGQVVQSFFDSYDGGRDGAFHGIWQPSKGEAFEGSFTAQCKFTAKADKGLQLTDLEDELSKAKRLASRGLADNYILLTNARLTGSAEEKIRQAFEAIPNIKRFAAYGRERISQIIRESPRLRMLVPRVYGLGDLSQILDERAYAQAQEILSSIGDDLAKFVITEAYQRSARALVEHGFVLLLGEPACGKSTIAAALSVGALDEWGCSTIKVRDADDFKRHWNPHEPKQLFWVDDAFGPTQFERTAATGWSRVFPDINAAIRRGAKVLFTSRDYIYKAAREYLKESALPVIKESQVVIQVEKLTKDEREQILYNHVRLGTQTQAVKAQLKPYLPYVAAHPRYSPEIARRLGNPLFTKHLIVSQIGLADFVERPLELLKDIVRNIDADSRSALALVFMRGGILPSPLDMTAEERHAVTLMGGSVGGVRTALNTLDGSLLIKSFQSGSHIVRFKHPTIRDAFASLVAEDLGLMDIYLAGTPIEQLFSEISCGDVGLVGVKVIVPPNRYETIMKRIESFDATKWPNKNTLFNFLSYRCDRDFIVKYIERYPQFISSLTVGSYLYVISDVAVIVRLHEYGLLPEQKRLDVVAAIKVLAIDTPDPGFLRDEIRSLLAQDEFDAILEQVRTDVLPRLDKYIAEWRWNYSGHDDPESHFSELSEAVEKYYEAFEDDEIATSQIENAFANIESTIEDLRSEQPLEPDSGDYYGGSSSHSHEEDHRSIFDDVDH